MNPTLAGIAMLGAALGMTLKPGHRLKYSLWRDEEHDPWSWSVWISKKDEIGATRHVEDLGSGDADTHGEAKAHIREAIESHGYSVNDAQRDVWG